MGLCQAIKGLVSCSLRTFEVKRGLVGLFFRIYEAKAFWHNHFLGKERSRPKAALKSPVLLYRWQLLLVFLKRYTQSKAQLMDGGHSAALLWG